MLGDDGRSVVRRRTRTVIPPATTISPRNPPAPMPILLQSNVLDVQHYRAGWKVPLGFVDVEILVETRRAGDGASIDSKLRERGFEVASDSRSSAS